ncbi:GntR family transcriptional regulator [Pantoea sp. Ap-967]|uniref:GntR family transcriptional regulator n=1 Tax=Pantoea sp. Ap-967 TaxID=2608362 RepID=UPI00141D8B3A|nr:GntR family transcriptional regulator [Pantoea sp. Ap-967]NIE75901.1 GntR family transcriptional regulator [Pantoea sp. Ap-967]
MNAAVDLSQPVHVDRKALLYSALCTRILTMEMTPGSTIVEQALCEEFGISRPPVRELLRHLAAEGYIELEANRSPRVVALTCHTLRHFSLAAPLIYCSVAQLASVRATPGEIKRLRANLANTAIAIAAGNQSSRTMLENSFNLEIGLIAKNQCLLPALRRSLIDHARIQKIVFPRTDDECAIDDVNTIHKNHESLVDAIERRACEQASQIARANFEIMRKRIIDYTSPEALDVEITI